MLLCSDCRVGRAKAGSLEVTTVPEPGSILLEQWTVSVLPAAVSRDNRDGNFLVVVSVKGWVNKQAGS